MPDCPVCAKPLTIIRQREGVYYHCATCGGRGLTVPQLRRVAGDRLGARVMRLLQLSIQKGKRPCPFCNQPMLSIVLAEPPLQMDGCRPCSIVWLDAPTYEAIPEGTAETTNSLPLQTTDIFAELRLKEEKKRAEEEEKKNAEKRKGFRRLLK